MHKPVPSVKQTTTTQIRLNRPLAGG